VVKIFKINPPSWAGKIKRVAESDETIVLVPIVLKPVEVQVTLAAVPIQVRNVEVTIRVPPDRNTQNITNTTTLRILSGLNLIRYLNIP